MAYRNGFAQCADFWLSQKTYPQSERLYSTQIHLDYQGWGNFSANVSGFVGAQLEQIMTCCYYVCSSQNQENNLKGGDMKKRQTENRQASSDPFAEMKRALAELEQVLDETRDTNPQNAVQRPR